MRSRSSPAAFLFGCSLVACAGDHAARMVLDAEREQTVSVTDAMPGEEAASLGDAGSPPQLDAAQGDAAPGAAAPLDDAALRDAAQIDAASAPDAAPAHDAAVGADAPFGDASWSCGMACIYGIEGIGSGLLRYSIYKADALHNRCTRIVLVGAAPSAPQFAVSTPSGLSFEGASMSPLASACTSAGLVAPRDAELAQSGTGFIRDIGPEGCSLDVDVTLTFGPGPSWLPREDRLIIAGLDTHSVGCLPLSVRP